MTVGRERRQQVVDRFLRLAPPLPQFHQRRVDDDAMEPGV
jgi:hypothetical protein